MSKFTKALQKIQEERTADVGNEPWDRGIATVKNTVPDNRVVALRFPDSVVAEQYRMLRTSFKAQLAKEGGKVILISSSIHAEGKTLTATNLAASLVEDGQTQVALVDADLRRGRVAEYLGFMGKQPGLTDFLSNGLSSKRVMIRNSIKNLLVIPRGDVAKKPSELVGSQKLHYLLTELRAHVDYVLVDSPPIMSVADAGILARETDGVLFIIQAGRTPKSVIAHAHQLFKQSNAKILGYVLTNVEFQSPDYRYYSYYPYADNNPIGLKEKTQFRLKQAGWNFKDLEERFHYWWTRRVLKKKRRHSKG